MGEEQVTIHAARIDRFGAIWFQLAPGGRWYDKPKVGVVYYGTVELLDRECGPTQPVRIATTDRVGRCGESAPTIFGSRTSQTCVLPSGHAGWHSAADGCEWGPVPRGNELLETPPADLTAEQHIRALALGRASHQFAPAGFNADVHAIGDVVLALAARYEAYLAGGA